MTPPGYAGSPCGKTQVLLPIFFAVYLLSQGRQDAQELDCPLHPPGRNQEVQVLRWKMVMPSSPPWG